MLAYIDFSTYVLIAICVLLRSSVFFSKPRDFENVSFHFKKNVRRCSKKCKMIVQRSANSCVLINWW